MALEKEIATYQKNLGDLVKDEGKFVLIYGDDLAGVFSSQEDALVVGYKKYKLEPFLVKRIEREERIFYFTRGVTPGIFHAASRP